MLRASLEHLQIYFRKLYDVYFLYMVLITKTGERSLTEIMTKIKEVLFMYTSEPKH